VPDIPPSIAVVDDDESVCKALSRLLRASGYAVLSYSSAEAFLDDPQHDRVDFLVADIGLGGMSGFELKERLHAEAHEPPVAFITAHDEAAVRKRARSSGCVAYLRKPFPGIDLLNAIHQAIPNSGEQDQPT